MTKDSKYEAILLSSKKVSEKDNYTCERSALEKKRKRKIILT